MVEAMAEDEFNLVVRTSSSRAIFSVAIAEKWGTKKLIVRLNRRINNNSQFQ